METIINITLINSAAYLISIPVLIIKDGMDSAVPTWHKIWYAFSTALLIVCIIIISW